MEMRCFQRACAGLLVCPFRVYLTRHLATVQCSQGEMGWDGVRITAGIDKLMGNKLRKAIRTEKGSPVQQGRQWEVTQQLLWWMHSGFVAGRERQQKSQTLCRDTRWIRAATQQYNLGEQSWAALGGQSPFHFFLRWLGVCHEWQS